MTAYELADQLEKGANRAEPHFIIAIRVRIAANMLRQQADRLEMFERESKMLMQHIADINEEKKRKNDK